MEEMDAREVFNWMAYEYSIVPENHEKLSKEIALDRSGEMSGEQRSLAIINMFKGLSANGSNK